MKSPKRLTRKQKKAAQERVKDPEASLSELSKRSVYASKTAVKRELDKPHVQDYIRRLMEKDPETAPKGLHKKLKEGLSAMETKFFQHEGEVIETRDCIDYSTRHRYIETAADWAGISEKRIRITQDPEPEMTLEQAMEILSRAQCLKPQPPQK